MPKTIKGKVTEGFAGNFFVMGENNDDIISDILQKCVGKNVELKISVKEI